jgi:hypothetical protein
MAGWQSGFSQHAQTSMDFPHLVHFSREGVGSLISPA